MPFRRLRRQRQSILLMMLSAFVVGFAMTLAGLALAQTPAPVPVPAPAVFDWKVLVAGLINSVLVVGAVQLIKVSLPKLRESVPWALPLIAMVGGPLLVWGQNQLMTVLGVPVDLSPLMGVLTGGTAVALNQVVKQTG
jgi:uncharacterized membrane protein YdcZ (DUF606 family)